MIGLMEIHPNAKCKQGLNLRIWLVGLQFEGLHYESESNQMRFQLPLQMVINGQAQNVYITVIGSTKRHINTKRKHNLWSLFTFNLTLFLFSLGSAWSRCLKETAPPWNPPIWTRHQTKGRSQPQQTLTLEKCPPLLLACLCPCATWRRVRKKRKSQSRAGMEVQSSSLYLIVECVLCKQWLVWLNTCKP